MIRGAGLYGRLRKKEEECLGKGKTEDKLPKEIVAELAAIGLTRATDVLSFENGLVTIKPPEQMKPGHAAAIAGVEKTATGCKIKFYDKLKALELLGTYLGMFGTGGKKDQEENNLLEAILSSTQEAMETGDIPEFQQTATIGDDLVESQESAEF